MRKLSLTILLSFAFVFGSAQLPAMDFGFDTYAAGGGSSQWHLVYNGINFIKNGNFNQSFIPSCDYGSGCHTGTYIPNQTVWDCDDGPSAPSYMAPLWQDTINWPYNLQWFCEINPMGASYPGYFQGFMEVRFIQPLTSGDLSFNYLMFQFNNPLPIGTPFRFEMDVSGAPMNTGTIYTDQIGAAIVHDLPELIPNSFLGDQITPNVTSPTGIPIQQAPYHMTYDFIGNGENFLIIGIFQDPNNLNTTGSIEEFPTRYWLDNVKMYRPDCPNEHITINQEDVMKCAGYNYDFFATNGIAPYDWYVDGVLQAETSNEFSFVFDSLAHVVTVACDTGFCRTSASIDLFTTQMNFDLPADTTKLCDTPVFIDPELSIENLNFSTTWTYTVQDSLGNTILTDGPTYLNSIDFDFTVDVGMEYFVKLESSSQNCVFRDSITVIDPGPLLTEEDGSSFLLFDTQDELCINAQNGYISVVAGDYPLPLEFLWNNNTSFEPQNTIDSLSHGEYSVYIRDSLWHCQAYEFEILQSTIGCGIISGDMYADLDTNCTLDSADIPFFMLKVIAEPIGNFAFTDSLGHYELLVPPGEYTVHKVDSFSSLIPYCGYVEDPAIINTPGTILNNYNFVDTLAFDSLDLNLISFSCNSLPILNREYDVTATWQNISAYFVDCRLKYYPLAEELIYEMDSIPFPTEIVEDTLYVYFDNVAPMEIVECIIPSQVIQNTSNISNELPSNVEIQLLSEIELDSTNNAASFSKFIVAAYDPNIKTSYPAGFRDPKYTDIETEQIDYFIEFQNTGNYHATDIYIIDTLDTDLIPESIEIMGSSHYMEVLYYNGVVRFDFPNIMLPDSTSNESESHGHVHFKINPRPNLPHLTEITNTAYIYFDANEAIVTNSTLNTMFDCSYFMPEFLPEMLGECPETYINTSFASDFYETNAWWVNNEFVTTDLNFSTPIGDAPVTITHIISNELCGEKQYSEVIQPAEDASIELSSTNGFITATTDLNAIQYSWYLNNQLFAITTTNTLTTTVSGEYSVIAIDANGCSAFGEHFQYFYIQVFEADFDFVKLYPNPADQIAYVELGLSNGITNIQLINLAGQIVLEQSTTLKRFEIHLEDLANGCYTIQIQNENNVTSFPLFISHQN